MNRHPLGPGFTLQAAPPPRRRRVAWGFYASMAVAGLFAGGVVTFAAGVWP